jgi:hypothetical protein
MKDAIKYLPVFDKPEPSVLLHDSLPESFFFKE